MSCLASIASIGEIGDHFFFDLCFMQPPSTSLFVRTTQGLEAGQKEKGSRYLAAEAICHDAMRLALTCRPSPVTTGRKQSAEPVEEVLRC